MATAKQDGEVFLVTGSAQINAPIERCFALTCAIALVHEELGMNVAEGRTEGLVLAGDVVRWEGWQLGMRHFHVTHISGYNKPVFLQDTMLDGRFKTFQHDHHLSQAPNGTTHLADEVRFTMHWGFFGRAIARYILLPHIQRLVRNRFARIKGLAEGDGWKQYLSPGDGISQPDEVART